MKTVEIKPPYSVLAQYYDEFVTFHLPWFQQARRRVLGKIFRKGMVVCELGCGTGTTALALAAKGMRVFALDQSATMCRRARQKAKHAGAEIRVLHADMRDFRLPEAADLVMSEFGAINHLPAKSDLAQVFSAAANALKPGGYLYFDVSNRKTYDLFTTCVWEERPGVVVFHQGGYDSAREKGWLTMEFFVRSGSHWRRYRELLEEVCWTQAEVRNALSQAGFARIRSWDARPFFRGNPPWDTPGSRTFYLAVKKHGRTR